MNKQTVHPKPKAAKGLSQVEKSRGQSGSF